MEKRSPKAARAKRKMTREQMQLAIVKKKECDAKALSIVEQLLEPKIDPVWLTENLKHINRCHMEDVIEERAITRICGYVLCQKPLTVVINQKYHISLKDKKVYDVSKRKNFCSSNCFGASNYLLEQMLVSPLWMRDKEEIPQFKIFSKETLISKNPCGKEMDINVVERSHNVDTTKEKKDSFTKQTSTSDAEENQENVAQECTEQNVSGNLKDFVFETFKNMNFDLESKSTNSLGSTEKNNKDNNLELSKIPETIVEKETMEQCKDSVNLDPKIASKKTDIKTNVLKTQNEEAIEQCIYPKPLAEDSLQEGTDVIEQFNYLVEKDTADKNVNSSELNRNNNFVKEHSASANSAETPSNSKNQENLKDSLSHNNNKVESSIKSSIVKDKTLKSVPEKLKSEKKQRKVKSFVSDNINLAARIEKCFQEWVTEDTVNFLYGDESVKKDTIRKIENQDRYNMLCKKLNKLQFEDEQEDAEILEKPVLKPAPHFAVLKEEGEKLDIKVRAFYQGKATFEEYKRSEVEQDNSNSDVFVPLTEAHAPQAMRRKIFLDKLDQVLPDLLRTLAGNNEVYYDACCNYTSIRCVAIKALVQTFSLSATNIIFKSPEWALVGLVIIKMLSLIDDWLSKLLITKRANMYISMILTSYKLDPNYLNLFVASFNPNMNPK